MILSEEYEELFQQHANAMRITLDEFKRLIQHWAIVFSESFNSFRELVDPYIEEINESVYLDDKPEWLAPKKILMKSQVMNRKPLIARARSNCS
jgi:hypothetical protein